MKAAEEGFWGVPSEPCKTLLDCLGQSYNDSCVLTNFSELVMLFEISVYVSKRISVNAYEVHFTKN